MLAFPYLKHPPADHFEIESVNAVQAADTEIRQLIELTRRQGTSLDQTVTRAYETGRPMPLELAELCHQQEREVERLIDGFLTLIDSILASPRAYLLSGHTQSYLTQFRGQTYEFLRDAMTEAIPKINDRLLAVAYAHDDDLDPDRASGVEIIRTDLQARLANILGLPHLRAFLDEDTLERFEHARDTLAAAA